MKQYPARIAWIADAKRASLRTPGLLTGEARERAKIELAELNMEILRRQEAARARVANRAVTK